MLVAGESNYGREANNTSLNISILKPHGSLSRRRLQFRRQVRSPCQRGLGGYIGGKGSRRGRELGFPDVRLPCFTSHSRYWTQEATGPNDDDDDWDEHDRDNSDDDVDVEEDENEEEEEEDKKGVE